MSVLSLLIALQASRSDGRGVTIDEFLVPMDVQPGEAEFVLADGGAWQAGMIGFSTIRLSDCVNTRVGENAEEPAEVFFARVREAMFAVGRFLARRSPETTAKLQAAGLSLRLFIEVRCSQDQIELDLPAELLSECGRHALGVYLISNDTPTDRI